MSLRHRGYLTGADGLAVVLVLGIAEGAEDDALFGGHDRPNLASSDVARSRGHGAGHHVRVSRAARGTRRRWCACSMQSERVSTTCWKLAARRMQRLNASTARKLRARASGPTVQTRVASYLRLARRLSVRTIP